MSLSWCHMKDSSVYLVQSSAQVINLSPGHCVQIYQGVVRWWVGGFPYYLTCWYPLHPQPIDRACTGGKKNVHSGELISSRNVVELVMRVVAAGGASGGAWWCPLGRCLTVFSLAPTGMTSGIRILARGVVLGPVLNFSKSFQRNCTQRCFFL